MALRAVLNAEAFGELDESTRAFYVEKDGNYVLDAEGVDELPQVKGLKSTLEKYRKVDTDAGRLKRRMDALAPWEVFADRNPDEVTSALSELDELRAKGGGKGSDELKSVYENRMKAAVDAEAKKRAAVEEESARLSAHLEKLLIVDHLNEMLGKLGVTDERVKKAVRNDLRAEHKFRVIREGDEYHAIVQTADGDQDVSTFMEAWGRSEDAKAFLPPSGNKGSGAGGGSGVGSGGGDNPWATGNLTEQGRIFSENPTLAKTLAARAGKKLPTLVA
jgi:hypothetical protein